MTREGEITTQKNYNSEEEPLAVEEQRRRATTLKKKERGTTCTSGNDDAELPLQTQQRDLETWSFDKPGAQGVRAHYISASRN